MTLKVEGNPGSDDLRVAARREQNGRAAARMYAIASALDGVSRAQAARMIELERQALCDSVTRYNAEGLDGLYDRPKGRPPRKLTAEREQALCKVVLDGPDPEMGNCCSRTRTDLCDWLERHYDKTCHPTSMGRILKRLGFSRQKARPAIPSRTHRLRRASKKGASNRPEQSRSGLRPSPE